MQFKEHDFKQESKTSDMDVIIHQDELKWTADKDVIIHQNELKRELQRIQLTEKRLAAKRNKAESIMEKRPADKGRTNVRAAATKTS